MPARIANENGVVIYAHPDVCNIVRGAIAVPDLARAILGGPTWLEKLAA